MVTVQYGDETHKLCFIKVMFKQENKTILSQAGCILDGQSESVKTFLWLVSYIHMLNTAFLKLSRNHH